MHLLDLKKLFNGVNVLACAVHAFSATAVLPVCRAHWVHLSSAVGPVLNVTIGCQKITFNIFSTVTLILS